jgi:hypothetical protein
VDAARLILVEGMIGSGKTATALPARATHVPHATVSRGQQRSVTGTPTPLTRNVIPAGQPAGLATELPSRSCGFDYRRPLSEVIRLRLDTDYLDESFDALEVVRISRVQRQLVAAG